MQEALDIDVLALSPIIPHVTHTVARIGTRHGADRRAVGGCRRGCAMEQSRSNSSCRLNGKLRARIVVARTPTMADLAQAALADPNVQKFVGSAMIAK